MSDDKEKLTTEALRQAQELRNSLFHGIQEHAKLAVTVGIVLLVVGILAIAAPFAAGLSITVAVGLMLVLGGVGQCMLAFKIGALGRSLMICIFGLLMLVIGIFLLRQPVAGLASITLFMTAYFITSGVFELVAAIQLRPEQGRGWMLFNGIITLILGLLIWMQMPLSDTWAVGILFGIKMVFSGWALIFIGRNVNKLDQ